MKRHSLHIGIDRYEDRTIRDLPFCTADAALLASFFRDVAGYESVRQLDNPTRGAILDAVDAEAGLLGSGDLLVLTYSGHGLSSENEGPLLVAVDSRAERLRVGVDGVPLRRLEESIRGAGAHLVVFLDACQSYDGGTRGGFSRTSSQRSDFMDRYLTVSVGDFTGPCLFVMSPEKTLEIPALGHGLFTAALHRALLEAHKQRASAPLQIHEGTQTQMKSLCEAHGIPCPSVFMEYSGAVGTCRLWSGRTRKRHALFVGVDEYADPTIQDLRYPSEDAAELASVFRRQLKFDRVEKLINPAHAAEVLDCVEAMTTGLGSDDLFLFFFAGHGFRVKENHVLVCAKDKYTELEDEYDGLPVGRLKKRMRGPWNQMLVLDACQNDIRTTRGADTGVTARDLKLIHAAVSGGGDSGCQIVVTSCSEGQRALEVSDLGHGLFTSAFLDSVTSFADARQRIDPEVLRADLGKRMGRLIDRYRLSGEQDPLFTMPSSAADIVLFDGASPVPNAIAPVRPVAPAPTLVVCPICGKKNEPKDTFKCKECGRDNLCLRHQDENTFLCRDCVAKARAETRRKARATARRAAEQRAREAAERKSSEDRNRPAGTRSVLQVGAVEVALLWCPPGTFTMGSPPSEEGRFSDERQHRVTLTKGFWMGETAVTQELWKEVMGANPSYNESGDDYPVENVSWDDCQSFLATLNRKCPIDEHRWALPTEAQWEYACRAGRDGPFGGTGRLDDMGWYGKNSYGTTHPVGVKRPNAWGLHDMHGNVWEWCADWDGEYPTGAVTDPIGPASGVARVDRGGGWPSNARGCRSALRDRSGPGFRGGYLGFRVALAPVSER